MDAGTAQEVQKLIDPEVYEILIGFLVVLVGAIGFYAKSRLTSEAKKVEADVKAREADVAFRQQQNEFYNSFMTRTLNLLIEGDSNGNKGLNQIHEEIVEIKDTQKATNKRLDCLPCEGETMCKFEKYLLEKKAKKELDSNGQDN